MWRAGSAPASGCAWSAGGGGARPAATGGVGGAETVEVTAPGSSGEAEGAERAREPRQQKAGWGGEQLFLIRNRAGRAGPRCRKPGVQVPVASGGGSVGRLLLRFRKTEATSPKKAPAGATGVRQGVHNAGTSGLIFSLWQGCSAHLLRLSGDRSDYPRAAHRPGSGPHDLRPGRDPRPGRSAVVALPGAVGPLPGAEV